MRSESVTMELKDVKKYFDFEKRGVFSRRKIFLKAVDGVNFRIIEGQTTGLIGESGCGKTTLGKLLLRLERPTSGMILFKGKDIQRLSGVEHREYRRSVQAVFQNPYASLNPRMRIGDIIAEPIIYNDLMPKETIRDRVTELLQQVRLGDGSAHLYPHEFSGGQRQRIAVARALASKPSFIILDEPVSALDVSIRGQILNLLKKLQGEFGIGYLFISHDIGLTIHMSHRIEVLYSGIVIESMESKKLYQNALHPYTKALIWATSLERQSDQKEWAILAGEVPDPLDPPPGCRFHPRCPRKMPKCSLEEPLLKEVTDGHKVRCHLAM